MARVWNAQIPVMAVRGSFEANERQEWGRFYNFTASEGEPGAVSIHG